MSRGVLYFPYMSVPCDEWFVRVLLYWERIGSIIPGFEVDAATTPFTRELLKAGLLDPIHPEQFLDPSDTSEFLETLETNGEREKAPDIWAGAPTTLIHLGKMGYRVGGALQSLGLAREVDFPWLEVEEHTAARYMTFLAAVIGRVPRVDMDPITDQAELLGDLCTSAYEARRADIQMMRLAVLSEVLPAPVDSISVAELLGFKEEHGERLISFRLAIERALIDLASTSDSVIREMKRDVLDVELAQEIVAIQRQLNRKWRSRAGAIAAVIPAAAKTSATAASHNYPALAGSLPPLASAIGRAAGHGSGRDLLNSPLAYAAHAQLRLGRSGAFSSHRHDPFLRGPAKKAKLI